MVCGKVFFEEVYGNQIEILGHESIRGIAMIFVVVAWYVVCLFPRSEYVSSKV